VPAVDAVATYDEEREASAIFMVNRAVRQQAQVEIDARSFGGQRVVECSTLTAPDVRVYNDATAPDRVRLQENAGAAVDGGRLSVVLPPVSWTMLRLAPAD
jgi:alpha-N-arabinofuranosidase